jgi:hypothetical protein
MEASEEWQPPYVSEDVAEAIQTSIHVSEAMLLGRVTYELFTSYWPTQTKNEFGVADKMNSQPKFVVSSTLDKAEWNNTTLGLWPADTRGLCALVVGRGRDDHREKALPVARRGHCPLPRAERHLLPGGRSPFDMDNSAHIVTQR